MEKLKELQELVEKRIDTAKSINDLYAVSQLTRVLFELMQIEKNPSFELSYPRMIIDSFDFDDDLANQLLEYAYFIKKRK